LIGLAAALLSDDAARHAPALWSCFDRGSWVAPQLAVALLWSDTDFLEEAKRRIVARCPTVYDDRKNITSLLRALAYVPSEAGWTTSQLSAPDVHELLGADQERADAIVEQWFERAQTRFRELGRNLGPAA
jgi:hypothetical protein